MSQTKKLLLGLVVFLIAWFCYANFIRPQGPVGVTLLSISTDGRYVVGNNQTDLILWDIEKKKRKRVAKKVNIFSAYFIRNSPYYMYQDLDNIVHVKHIDGTEVKTIALDFPTYGHVMTTDLSRYFASDADYRIVKVEDSMQTLVKGLDSPGRFYGGKLLNLQLSSDDSLLLASGDSSGGHEPSGKRIFIDEEITTLMKWQTHTSRISLWDANTGAPRLVFTKLSNKQSATLSPDMSQIIGVDEGGWMAKIDMDSKEYTKFIDRRNEVFALPNGDQSLAIRHIKHDDASHVKVGYDDNYPGHGLRPLFITPTEYMKFSITAEWIVVFPLDDIMPVAYLDMGRDPFPSVHDYSRNGSIDASPYAHRLVTGKNAERGIMVYDYHPEAKTLTKIWDSR